LHQAKHPRSSPVVCVSRRIEAERERERGPGKGAATGAAHTSAFSIDEAACLGFCGIDRQRRGPAAFTPVSLRLGSIDDEGPGPLHPLLARENFDPAALVFKAPDTVRHGPCQPVHLRQVSASYAFSSTGT
jgi:hypothetical protein